MVPVTQVRTGYGRGQCTEASIASLLEVPLEAVPDIWAGPHVPLDAPGSEHQPLALTVKMWEWLKREHGVMLCGIKLRERAPTIREAWLRSDGLFPFDWSEAAWSRFHIACGPNPDGVEHCVVCERGELAWDPNPSRRGIVACQFVQWLVPLDLLPASVLELPSAEWREA